MKNNRLTFIISLSLALLLLALSLLGYFVLFPQEIPIFYSLAQSQEWLSPKEWIFILPTLAFLFTGVQAIYLKRFKEDDEIAQTFGWCIVVLCSLLSIAFLRITFLVL